MSDTIADIDVDSDEYLDAPKALRDHVKKLQSRLSERDAEVGTLRGQLTATALTDVLREFKNPERVKKDLLFDKVDPLDSEAVTKWLESNAGDYAKGAATSTSTPVTPDPEADAHARLQASGDLRQPADMSKIEAAQAEITSDMNGAQVIEVYRKHGL